MEHWGWFAAWILDFKSVFSLPCKEKFSVLLRSYWHLVGVGDSGDHLLIVNKAKKRRMMECKLK